MMVISLIVIRYPLSARQACGRFQIYSLAQSTVYCRQTPLIGSLRASGNRARETPRLQPLDRASTPSHAYPSRPGPPRARNKIPNAELRANRACLLRLRSLEESIDRGGHQRASARISSQFGTARPFLGVNDCLMIHPEQIRILPVDRRLRGIVLHNLSRGITAFIWAYPSDET